MKEKETMIFAENCCSGPSITIPVMPYDPQLSQTYTPYQVYMGILPAMEGHKKGTVFQELYQPYFEKQYEKREDPWMKGKSTKEAVLPELYRPNPVKPLEDTLISDRNIKGNVSPEPFKP